MPPEPMRRRPGRFERRDSAFRNWVTPDGRPGPTGSDGFSAGPGRYHLYVSLACPWAHRALIMRALKGLEQIIPVSVTHWLMGEQGWSFTPGEGVIPDPLFNGAATCTKSTRVPTRTIPAMSPFPCYGTSTRRPSSTTNRPRSSGCSTAPSTRSARGPATITPRRLRAEIDALNARVYDTLNNGVYKAGFATTQQAYEEAVTPLFETLDWLEERLARSRFLCGDTLTEADIRLFTTLVRFDAVYHGHFKCNIRRLIDYKNLWAYTRDVYQIPGVAPTVNFIHIKRHYYQSHKRINPNGIVPVGPVLDFDAPSERGKDIARLLNF